MEKPLPEAIPPCPFCGAEWQITSLRPSSAIHPGVMLDGSCVLAGQVFPEHRFELLRKRADG